MTRYKVSYIVNNQEKIQRAIDAESHEEAYERFLEIDGAKNYPIKTFSFENRTEKLWEDHYGLIKEQRKIIIQELITNSDKGVDYIQLNQTTRDFCEKYGFSLEHSCNTIIVVSKKEPKKYNKQPG